MKKEIEELSPLPKAVRYLLIGHSRANIALVNAFILAARAVCQKLNVSVFATTAAEERVVDKSGVRSHIISHECLVDLSAIVA